MKILALDTSTIFLSLALAEDEEIIAETHRRLKNKDHARCLIPEIDRLFKKSQRDLEDIDILCLGSGPGSFTGLRVALSTVKALNFSLHNKIASIPSMDAIAYNIDEQQDRIIACIQDAKKNKVYGALYKRDNGLVRLKGYLLMEFDRYMDLIREVKERENKEVIFTGEGCQVFKEDILKRLPEGYFAERRCWYPYAKNLARLVFIRLKEDKTFLSTGNKAELLYLHSQYANITKPKKL